MTTLKDKLSASVRQAKARAPETPPVASPPTVTPAKPVAPKTATRRSPPPLATPQPVAVPQPAAQSGFAFPDRVWPD